MGGVPEVGYPCEVPTEVRYPCEVPKTRVPPQPGLTEMGTWGGVCPWQGYPRQGLMGDTWGWVPLAGIPPARSDGGVPEVGSPWQGYPLAKSDGRHPRWGSPLAGVPWPGPMGGTPHQVWQGVPKVGYPPRQGYPLVWTWLGYLPLRCGQTDGQTRVKT